MARDQRPGPDFDKRIFTAYTEPYRPGPTLIRVVVDWPRLEAVVDDRADAVEVAENLIAEHFAVRPGLVQVDLRAIVDPARERRGMIVWH